MSQAFHQHQQASGAVTAEMRAFGSPKALKRIPQWKDQARYAKEAPEIHSALIQITVTRQRNRQDRQSSKTIGDCTMRDAWLCVARWRPGRTRFCCQRCRVGETRSRDAAADRNGQHGDSGKQLRQSTDRRRRSKP